MIDNTKVLVIDLETTDLDPDYGSIVEIGMILFDLTKKTDLTNIAYYSHLINERTRLNRDAWIFHNSSLTPEDVLFGGEHLELERFVIQSMLNCYWVTAFNSKFDFGWLESRGFKIPYKAPDPMYIMTDLLKIPFGSIKSTKKDTEIKQKYKWASVQESLDYFKLNIKEEHRASSDAFQEGQIILKLYEMGLYKLSDPLSVDVKLLTDREQFYWYQSKVESFDHLLHKDKCTTLDQLEALIQEKKAYCGQKVQSLGKTLGLI